MWYSNNYRADLHFGEVNHVIKSYKIIILFLKSEKIEYQEHRADVEIVCADGSVFVSLKLERYS